MKKLGLVLLLSFIITSLAHAQSDSSKFRLNAHIGLAGSQVAGDGLSGFNKLNLFGGLGVSTKFSEEWGVGFELNFVQKGSKRIIDPEVNNGQDEYKMSLNYIQVPVLFRYDYNEKLGFKAGPALGFLIDSKEEDFLGEITNSPEFDSFELSGIASLVFTPVGNLSTELRFDQSLLPIRSKDSGSGFQLDGRQFNTVLTLLVSYTIK